jgi:hypothetical protein
MVLYLHSFTLFHGIVLSETQEQFCCCDINKLFTQIPANQSGSFCQMFQQPQFTHMEHTLCVVQSSYHSSDCDVTHCSLVDIPQSYGGGCYLHMQLLSSYDNHSFFLMKILISFQVQDGPYC